MDEVSKYRLTGAFIWLGLLVVIVPIWFSQPVGFKPEGYQVVQQTAERPLVEHAYVLPGKASQPEIKSSAVQPQSKDSVVAKQVSGSSQKASQSQWIVRIIAYKNIKDANDLLGRLESDFEVNIKTFEASGMHSVRTGPYFSKAKAEQDRQKLDKMLHTKSEVAQFK